MRLPKISFFSPTSDFNQGDWSMILKSSLIQLHVYRSIYSIITTDASVNIVDSNIWKIRKIYHEKFLFLYFLATIGNAMDNSSVRSYARSAWDDPCRSSFFERSRFLTFASTFFKFLKDKKKIGRVHKPYKYKKIKLVVGDI